MSGYVYLLHCEGRHKIGIAVNVAKRIAGIQTGNPFQVDLVASARVDNPEEYERELHQRYKSQRVKLEWFTLSAEDVDAIIREFQQRHTPEPPLLKPEDMPQFVIDALQDGSRRLLAVTIGRELSVKAGQDKTTLPAGNYALIVLPDTAAPAGVYAIRAEPA